MDLKLKVAGILDDSLKSGSLGVVIIGRDEGQRLRRCLESLSGDVPNVVYVDSGSTDQSVAVAQSFGADVVMLDDSLPFSAARARNAGFKRLLTVAPEVEHVQFLDGDCAVLAGWFEAATATLEQKSNVAVVCGRLMEVHREATIYNRIVDIEWDAPVGVVKSCGGCAMYRTKVFRETGGFDPTVIAGEEPELCVRIRRAGYLIERIEQPMATHDVDMKRFSQWWMRSVRAGYSYAQGRALHGSPPERHCVRQCRSIWLWALAVPVAVVATLVPTHGWSLILLAGYLVLAARIWRYPRSRGNNSFDSMLYTVFTVLGKWPQFYGQLKYHLRTIRGTRNALIEHKQ